MHNRFVGTQETIDAICDIVSKCNSSTVEIIINMLDPDSRVHVLNSSSSKNKTALKEARLRNDDHCIPIMELLARAGATSQYSLPPDAPLQIFCRAVKTGNYNQLAISLNTCSINTFVDPVLQMTALHYAVWHRMPELIKFLAQYQPKYTICNYQMLTPLQLADHLGHEDVIQAFLDIDDITPIQVDFTIIKKFRENFHRPTQSPINYRKEYFKMLEQGNAARVEWLLKFTPVKATIIDKNGNTGMHIAAERGHQNIIQALRRFSVLLYKKNRAGYIPLDLAVLNKHDTCIIEFYMLCVELNDNEKHKKFILDRLYHALTNNKTELFQFYLTHLADGGEIPKDSLHIAIRHHNHRIVIELLRHGICLDHLTNGITAIEFACQLKDWDIVRLIIEQHRADTTCLAPYNKALIAALNDKKADIVLYLLEAGVKLNCLNETPNGALCLDHIFQHQDAYQDIISTLKLAAKKEPAFLTWLNENYLTKLDSYIRKFFEDPILCIELTDPLITPQGTTYDIQSIAQVSADPYTRESLTSHDLLPNKLVKQLLEHYKSGADPQLLPPLLIDDFTKTIYQYPVVAADGCTYEKQMIEQYLKTHHNQLPSGIPQLNRKLYLNRLIQELIQAHYQAKVEITLPQQSQNFFGLFNSVSGSNNNYTDHPHMPAPK